MLKTSKSDELAFLHWMTTDHHSDYQKSRHLKTKFEENIWQLEFGKAPSLSIDFNIQLEDGSNLTDYKNHPLLRLLKSWICVQTHYDLTGGLIYSDATAYNATLKVIHVIDYFLLNAKHFKLSEYGLKNITENDIINLVAQIGSISNIHISIYKWHEKLTDYIRQEIKLIDLSILEDVVKKHPSLKQGIPREEERDLDLSENEIILSRALFWLKGFYMEFYKNSSDEFFKYTLDTVKVTSIIYKNTLLGVKHKSLISEFLLFPYEKYQREYPRAPVRTKENENNTKRKLATYIKAIRSLGVLEEVGDAIPIAALNVTSNRNLLKSINLSSQGRYSSLPQSVALNALKNSVEFALKYGEEILKSTIRVITAARDANVNCSTYAKQHDIRPLLTKTVRKMGVKYWYIAQYLQKPNAPNQNAIDKDAEENEYFQKLRGNEGLYELNRILFGAIQICIGTLMARRQGELSDLVSEQALDINSENLIFLNRKSGIGEMRSQEARPIPPLGAKLINMIQNYHSKLIKLNLASNGLSLFSSPSQITGLPRVSSEKSFNGNLDIFCDYFETDLTVKGQRFYIRQHQLRRFFAMMFFWGNAFGGMDTLRWFLGHTDVEHLYHYITESTPGQVLRSSKAQFVSDLIKTRPDESLKLSEILETKFGTNNFSVIDNDELEEYIDELMIENKLDIEPVFFEGPEGKTYRIAILIKDIKEED